LRRAEFSSEGKMSGFKYPLKTTPGFHALSSSLKILLDRFFFAFPSGALGIKAVNTYYSLFLKVQQANLIMGNYSQKFVNYFAYFVKGNMPC
jgi:hypothetical protein